MRQIRRLTHAAAAALFVAALPLVAFAAGGGGGGHGDGEPGGGGGGGHGGANEMFQDILMLLAVIGVAYLVTHLLLERIQRRFGLVSGVEYIVLGVLIGPALGFLDPVTLSKFTPAVVLGTGSLGLMTGLSLNFRRFEALDLEALRHALWISVVTLLVMVVVPLGIMSLLLPLEEVLLWTPGILCAGAIAMVASPGPVRSLRRFMAARGGSSDAAVRVARFCSTLAVVTFGLLFCMFDHDAVVLPSRYGMIEWLAVHLILGGLLGLVFATFLRREFEDDKILTIVIGVVIFTSGIAYYLRLSPIFVNLILGVVLANTCRQSDDVSEMLNSVERPLYIVLFFFAGASMTFGAPMWSLALVVPYLLLRSLARLTGGVIAMRTTTEEMEPLRIPALGRVMLAPGALSVAMLLDFEEVFGSMRTAELVYTTLLVAILLSEILSFIRTRSWLIDHTDVPQSTIRQVLSGSGDEMSKEVG